MIPTQPVEIRYYIALNGRDYYREWLAELDPNTRGRVLTYMTRLEVGMGFTKTIENKIWELVIDFGPGYRVFFTKEGRAFFLVFAGCKKKDQKRTIALVKQLLAEYESRKLHGYIL
jgi:putative addiction module killer protein